MIFLHLFFTMGRTESKTIAKWFFPFCWTCNPIKIEFFYKSSKCIEEYLNWATNVNQPCVKLVKTNAMLSKIWYFVNKTTVWPVLLSFILIYFMYVLLGDNLLFHLLGCAFYREIHIYFTTFNDHATQLFCKMKTTV